MGKSHQSLQCQKVVASHIREDLGLSGGDGSLSGPKWSRYNAPGASKVIRAVIEGAKRGPAMVLSRGQTCGGTCGRRSLQFI